MEHLQKLSEELVELTHAVAPWVVRVNGRQGPNATGILWSDRLIVTSHRACHRDSEIEVGLPDGSTVMARVQGRAPDFDLATLELETPLPDHQALPWADENKPGIVLAVARDRRGTLLSKIGLLPTEELVHRVAPAPEFLGSPLINCQGQFLGVHLVAGRPRAVSKSELKEMMLRLSDCSRISPAFLGLGLHRVETESGYQCLVVKAEGPADHAGFLIGDHLLSLDGEELTDPEQVREKIRGYSAGSTLSARIQRAGKTLDLEVELGERPHHTWPGVFKKQVKRVIRHLRHHHKHHHHAHHGPPHHRPWHHHHGPPPPPPEGPDLC